LEYYINKIGGISKSLLFSFDPETHFFKFPELNTNILFPLFVSNNANEKDWIIVRERIGGVNATTNFFHCSNVEKLIQILKFKYICIKGHWARLGDLHFVNIGVLEEICSLLNIDLTSSNHTASELIEKLKKHARGIPTEVDSSFLIAKQFDDAPRSNLDDKFILSPVNSFMRMSAVKLNWIENVIRSVGLTFGSELVQCAWLYKKEGKPFLFI